VFFIQLSDQGTQGGLPGANIGKGQLAARRGWAQGDVDHVGGFFGVGYLMLFTLAF
jgi:hypothetical protein